MNTMGRSRLHVAVLEGQIETVSDLLNERADINSEDFNGNTPLDLAVESQNFDITKLLLDHKTDFIATASRNCLLKSLKSAIKSRNLDILRLHLDTGIRIDYEILEYAVRFGNSKVVQLLIDAGVCGVSEVRLGERPLELAVRLNNENVVRALLNFNKTTYDSSIILNNALNIAATESNSVTILKLLVDAGADVNAKNYNGSTPFLKAAGVRNYDALKYLINAGADVHAFENYGGPALSKLLSLANENLINQCAKLIIDSTDVNFVDKLDRNPVNESLIKSKKCNSVVKKMYYKIIVKHVAKLKALELPVNSALTLYISQDTELADFLTKCSEELEKAKSTKLEKCWVTFFNLLVDDERKLVKYAGNDYLVDDFKKRVWGFPVYRTWLQTDMSRAVNARRSFDEALNGLSNAIPIFNPTHLVIRDTLEALMEDDWINLSENKHKRR